MENFEVAKLEMKNEIIDVMRVCFLNSEAVYYFFENKAKPKNCYVCKNDGKIVSVLHSLPSKIKLLGNIYPANYVYGACTLPGYRGRGFMTRLLKFANNTCEKKGDVFSFLVPENERLNKLYLKCGYENFFKTKTATLTANQMADLAKKHSKNNLEFKKFSYKSLGKLRYNMYNNINSVIYSSNELRYACEMYKYFGGEVIFCERGYAICVKIDFDVLKIIDFTCFEDAYSELISRILAVFPNERKYIIETYAGNKFFEKFGENFFHGMITSLNNQAREILDYFKVKNNVVSPPYLGLSLE